MERYIAVDAGKYATKVAEYDAKTKTVRKFQLRTCVSEGDFRDDAIEKNTVIVEIDGKVYKVGNGARGMGAALDTNKMSDDHRLCTLTAIAAVVSENEVDEINIAVGLPAKDWASVPKREDYKNYMFPDGDITVCIKKNSSSPVQKKTFRVKNKYAFPESQGALFMNGIVETLRPTSLIGVLDIGNLNLNATFWQGNELVQDKSATAEFGGAILIQELSQELSTNITACDELITANILKGSKADRSLPLEYGLSEEQQELSRTIIKKVLRNHAEQIKRVCRARNWPLDLIKIVAIGGTSEDIETELKEVFSNITLLENATFCNALGYLRAMCIKEEVGLGGSLISLEEKAKNTDSKAEKIEKAS